MLPLIKAPSLQSSQSDTEVFFCFFFGGGGVSDRACVGLLVTWHPTSCSTKTAHRLITVWTIKSWNIHLILMLPPWLWMGDYSIFLWQLSLLCAGLFRARFMPNSSLSPVKSPGIFLIAFGSSSSWSYKTNIGFIKLGGGKNQEST